MKNLMLAFFRLFEKWDLPVHDIKWYPGGSGISAKGSPLRPERMPPLMVRRAEWRR